MRSALFAMLLGVALVGCRHGLPPVTPGALDSLRADYDGQPQFAAVYYPYGPYSQWQLASPHPRYRGWTNRRMDRDLALLVEAGVDRVDVRIDPRQLDDATAERYIQFLATAATASDLLHVRPVSSVRGLDRAEVDALLTWLAALKLYQYAAADKLGGRPVVELLDSEDLGKIDSLELAVDQVRFERPKAFQRSGPLAYAARTPDGATVRVAAGFGGIDTENGGKETWLLPRRNGRTLAEGIALAASLKPRWILVDSWNNFETGNFVQPNSFDGTVVFDALSQAIRDTRGTTP